jgi:cobalamin-dependent methionine synthase I
MKQNLPLSILLILSFLIGALTLSRAFQLILEQATAAIIVHHKDAKYYSVGESSVEQMMR